MSTFDPDLVPLLAAAAEDGSLHLHFQPEVDLASGSVVGMEALLRWRHPTRGLLRPAEFFDAAEAGGLVRVLGQWAFRAAVAECRAWAERAWPTGQARVRLWLNVAAAQFTAPGFLVAMERLVRGRALPVGALGLELTEQTLAIGQVGTPRLLGGLRALGLALAVDDFGTWYASLATLDELPLDAVKLHRRFVQAMLGDVEGEALLASLISLAHRRGMVAVAEGVETAVEAARLTSLGCDRALGHLFCPPVVGEQARDLVDDPAGRYADWVPRPRWVRDPMMAAGPAL